MIELVRRGSSVVKGQVSDVVLKGLSLKNELNYNRETWAEWGLTDQSSIVNGRLKLSRTTATMQAKLATAFKANTKYGLIMSVHENTGSIALTGPSAFADGSFLLSGTGNKAAVATTLSEITINEIKLKMSANSNYAVVSDIRVFELPAGSQIETDFNTLTADQLAQKYPYIKGDSVKSTISNIRLQSVGRNLFNKNGIIKSGYIGISGSVAADATSQYADFYITIKPGTTYKLSKNVFIAQYDSAYNFINRTTYSVSSVTTETNTKFIRLSHYQGGLTFFDDLILNEGSVLLPYEPYKLSQAYISAGGELRSVSSVKDEVSLTQGIKTQKINPYVLQAGDIINAISYTTTTVVYTRDFADMKDGTNAIDGSIAFADGRSETVFTNRDISSYTGQFYTLAGFPKRIHFIFPLGTTLEQAKTALAGQALTYQLATPVTTQIEPQPLTVFPGGSVWAETGCKEVATYANGIAITNTSIPIKQLVKVDKLHIVDGHWKRSSIDLTNVTVAGNGLSFTITGATNGEQYEFAYDYDSSLSTLPEIVVPSLTDLVRANRTICL